MSEREIPRGRWRQFCDRFTREHRGWTVTMGVLDTERLEADSPTAAEATRILGSDVILQSVTAARGVRGIDLSITTGDERTRLTRILLYNPVRLRFELASSGAHRGLRIDTLTGQTMLIRLRTAARPDLLHGTGETAVARGDQNA